MNKLILAFGLITLLTVGDALKCYQCGNCGDLKENKSTVCPVLEGVEYKSCFKTTISDVTTRGCVPTGINFCDVAAAGTDCHTCDEDDCNASASLVASAVLGLASLVVLRLVH